MSGDVSGCDAEGKVSEESDSDSNELADMDASVTARSSQEVNLSI